MLTRSAKAAAAAALAASTHMDVEAAAPVPAPAPALGGAGDAAGAVAVAAGGARADSSPAAVKAKARAPSKGKGAPAAAVVVDKMKAECESLARAWGWVLHGASLWWTYNCDSGCFADTCTRSTHTEGPFLVIYQPMKSMLEYEDFITSINIKRLDKKPISAKLWEAAQPHIAAVTRLLLQSYNDVLAATDGKWDASIDGSFDALVHTKQPLHLAADGALKFKFEIRGATDGCCGNRWEPGRLMAWLGTESSLFAADGSVKPGVNIADEMCYFNKPSTPARV